MARPKGKLQFKTDHELHRRMAEGIADGTYKSVWAAAGALAAEAEGTAEKEGKQRRLSNNFKKRQPEIVEEVRREKEAAGEEGEDEYLWRFAESIAGQSSKRQAKAIADTILSTRKTQDTFRRARSEILRRGGGAMSDLEVKTLWKVCIRLQWIEAGLASTEKNEHVTIKDGEKPSKD